MSATYKLNELLHKNEIPEKVRSQFVGTCLLSLKNGLNYNTAQSTNEILNRIKDILENLLNTSNSDRKKEKIQILYKKVFDEQKIRNLTKQNFVIILEDIKLNILPFIKEDTEFGQDLLNLFFTTFNKYVGKADKNQAFTPDHIVHFMCRIAEINKNSYVLDPTCGSGAFLVQAMVKAISDCDTQEEKDDIKQNHIFGIENEEKAYGLATTNMLIHGDGNTNIVFQGKTGQKGCFDFTKTDYPKVNVILMNPPYNAVPKGIPDNLKDGWGNAKNGTTDPSKGLVFVNHCIKFVNNGGILLCLLPMSCAIGSSAVIQNEKYKILQNNTLEAVFTLPSEMFFPGASVGACCMVFEVGTSHFVYNEETRKYEPRKETFFGYFKDDGLVKKKNLGRVDVKNKWKDIEKLWLDLYFARNDSGKNENRSRVKAGLSVLKKVSYDDEWLAEAYMKTDYSTLKQEDFEQTVRDYLSYLIKNNINIDD